MIKILLIDRYEVIATGLGLLLDAYFPEAILYTGKSLNEGVGHIEKQISFDLIILADNVPEAKPEKMIRKILRMDGARQILVFPDKFDSKSGLFYYKTGASGYLSKQASKEEIRHAIKALLNDGKYVSPNILTGVSEKQAFKYFGHVASLAS